MTIVLCYRVKSKCDNFLHSCTEYTEAVKRCREGITLFQELHGRAKETSEKMVKLNEKNVKLRKIIIDKLVLQYYIFKSLHYADVVTDSVFLPLIIWGHWSVNCGG